MAQAGAQRARRGAHDRRVQRGTVESTDGRRRRRPRGGRHGAENRSCAAAHRNLPRRPRSRRVHVDPQGVNGRSVQARRSRRRRDCEDRRRRGSAHRDARSDAARRGRAARDREPHGTGQGDDRRLELRPEQVQPRGAGVPAARIDVQADRLHSGDRSRLHTDLHDCRRAGELSRRERTDLQPAQLRSQVPRSDYASLRPRGIAQHPGDQDDGHARAEERARLCQAVRVRGRLSAVPADCARRRRRDAPRYHERVHDVSESGRAHEAVLRAQREGSRRQPARGKPR